MGAGLDHSLRDRANSETGLGPTAIQVYFSRKGTEDRFSRCLHRQLKPERPLFPLILRKTIIWFRHYELKDIQHNIGKRTIIQFEWCPTLGCAAALTSRIVCCHCDRRVFGIRVQPRKPPVISDDTKVRSKVDNWSWLHVVKKRPTGPPPDSALDKL